MFNKFFRKPIVRLPNNARRTIDPALEQLCDMRIAQIGDKNIIQNPLSVAGMSRATATMFQKYYAPRILKAQRKYSDEQQLEKTLNQTITDFENNLDIYIQSDIDFNNDI